VPAGTGTSPALGHLVADLSQQVDLVPVGTDPAYRVFENAAKSRDAHVDTLEISHEAASRRGFAIGAVRGAEWLAGKSGAWEFREIFGEL